MKRTGGMVVALVASLCAPAGAQAQSADLTRATCAQLLDLPRNERGQLIVWLHGYYAGAAQRAILDRDRLEAAFAAVQEACQQQRAMPLIGAEARAVLLGEPVLTPPTAPSPPRGTEAPSRSRSGGSDR